MQSELETWFSYSLRDFLMFSKETWLLLYQDYTRQYWWIAAAITLMLLIAFVLQYQRKRMTTLLADLQLIVLASCIAYYQLFYLQINPFARIVTYALVVQALLVLFERFRMQQHAAHSFSLFVNNGVKKASDITLASGALVLLATIVMAYLYSAETILLIPGVNPAVGLILLMYLLKRQENMRFYLFIIPFLVVTIEILTLYLLGMFYWWGLAFALLPLLMPAKRQ